MCEQCAKRNTEPEFGLAFGRVWARMYGGPADGSIAHVPRSLESVRLPELGGGAWVYTWAKGPVGSDYEHADVLVCPGTEPLARANNG